MQTTKCPVCHSDVIIDDEAVEGDLFSCLNCDAQIIVSSLHPISTELLEEEAE